MTPKVTKPKPPPTPISANDMKNFSATDSTARGYDSLIANASGAAGLMKKANVQKRALLGGTA